MASPTFNPVRELRGLALPTQRDPRGAFNSKREADAAWGDLLRAVLVPQGSQLMRRQFGSSLYDMLFDPLDIEDELVATLIRETAERSCPHVRIREVKLSINGTHVEIGIVFSLTSDPASVETRVASVKRSVMTAVGVA